MCNLPSFHLRHSLAIYFHLPSRSTSKQPLPQFSPAVDDFFTALSEVSVPEPVPRHQQTETEAASEYLGLERMLSEDRVSGTIECLSEIAAPGPVRRSVSE